MKVQYYNMQRERLVLWYVALRSYIKREGDIGVYQVFEELKKRVGKLSRLVYNQERFTRYLVILARWTLNRRLSRLSGMYKSRP